MRLLLPATLSARLGCLLPRLLWLLAPLRLGGWLLWLLAPLRLRGRLLWLLPPLRLGGRLLWLPLRFRGRLLSPLRFGGRLLWLLPPLRLGGRLLWLPLRFRGRLGGRRLGRLRRNAGHRLRVLSPSAAVPPAHLTGIPRVLVPAR
ncbi:MAG: hypothetical protein U0R23_08130 [Candidatus Nanopelagicales bacterium]